MPSFSPFFTQLQATANIHTCPRTSKREERQHEKGAEGKIETSGGKENPSLLDFRFHRDLIVTIDSHHMRIHPAAPTVGGKKDLRRLPHVYSKVLELLLPADTDVEVFEGPDAFHFVAALAAGARGGVVRVRTVRIHPGVTKVVVQAGGGTEGAADDAGDSMELDRWRSRLPEPSCPAMTVAGYVDGQLVVTVPKGPGGGEGGDGGQGEVTWRCSGGGKISGRLVVVQ